MDSFVLMAFVATLGTWFVTALGAATVVFFTSPRLKALNLMLGFSAGVMIAASFWSLLEPAIARAERMPGLPAWLVATAGFLTGALFLWASDKLVSRALGKVERDGVRRSILLVLSITIHNIPEGLAVGVAFGALAFSEGDGGLTGAWMLALGIGLQNFPEGAAVSLPLRREGMGRGKAFFLGQFSGAVEPVAGVLGALLAVGVREILPFLLSFAAGAMVSVVVAELVPESQRNPRRGLMTLATLGGFAVMMALDVALG